MALKLGNAEGAAREYATLLERADLSDAHRVTCLRKMEEAALAVAAAAREPPVRRGINRARKRSQVGQLYSGTV